MVHRVGVMVPGDRIVFVGTAAEHRREALEACAYLIDRLKTDAPFWKRERLGDDARWVEARDSDAAAAERWSAAD
jgi:molybdopterin synthase catalytic subunit